MLHQEPTTLCLLVTPAARVDSEDSARWRRARWPELKEIAFIEYAYTAGTIEANTPSGARARRLENDVRLLWRKANLVDLYIGWQD
jgi:hypothetical protein